MPTTSPTRQVLSPTERAVLEVLVTRAGRVVARHDLARLAGLLDRSVRRCDSVLVELRRRLGDDAVRTVRSRGWMLETEAVERAVALLEERCTNTP
jgi:DNA-binding response OmpR family regulator